MPVHMQNCEYCNLIRRTGEKCCCGHVAGNPVTEVPSETLNGSVKITRMPTRSVFVMKRAQRVMVVHSD